MQINRYSLVSAALLALVTLNSQGTEAGRPRSVPVAAAMESGQVIVQYRSGASVLRSSQILSASAAAERVAAGPQGAATLGARLGLSLEDGRPVSSRMQVLKASGMQSAALAKRLAADADVEWAVVDGRRHALAAPNDPLYANGQTSNSLTAGQWYLRAPDSTVRSSVNAEGAWALTEGSNAVVVAVLDTGVRLDHPDLSGKLLSGYDFIADTSTANDGSGRDSDPSDPGDWITSTENASGTFKDCGASSSSWHGTQVSGLVGAATHNALGMAGTAPATMILPVRVLGKCGGYDSDIIAGMRWA
ncbi:S8 family serine peptidase, partial [Ideonella sp.]|uniref:S8 family serine peptidase n=1 Tax=Ideonella sp. TaxID=1929293 RepID=UPI003BB70BD3